MEKVNVLDIDDRGFAFDPRHILFEFRENRLEQVMERLLFPAHLKSGRVGLGLLDEFISFSHLDLSPFSEGVRVKTPEQILFPGKGKINGATS
jgi:hypothetical protein